VESAQKLFERAMKIAHQQRSKAGSASLEGALEAVRLVRRGRRAASSHEAIERELIGRLGGGNAEDHETSLRLLRILQTLSVLDNAASERASAEAAPKQRAPELDGQAVLDQTRLALPSRPASLAAAAYAKNQHAGEAELRSLRARRNDNR
jgi:hypothetical protein